MFPLLLLLAQPPMPLPPAIVAPAEVTLPKPENFLATDPRLFGVRPQAGSWQLAYQSTVLRDFGQDSQLAGQALKEIRELMPTQWAEIGTGRPVVGYALSTNNMPIVPLTAPKNSVPIDLRTVRAEGVRGAWCLRDDANILLNFGPNRDDAAQAAGVVRKYGFNRLAHVGKPTPVLSYFAVVAEAPKPAGPNGDAKLTAALQEQALTRTGVEVPGVGYMGERFALDPRKVEYKKDRGEWVLAHGPDVLARFGGNEWTAREAARLVQDGRYTDFCRAGGLTFFLLHGRAADNVPFHYQAGRFAPSGLKPREMAGKWWVCDATGKQLFPAESEAEAGQLVKLVKAYGFDMVCQIGSPLRGGLRFLAKAK